MDIQDIRKKLNRRDKTNIDRFFLGYVECMLGTESIGENNFDIEEDKPLDAKYSAQDIDDTSLLSMYVDCERFKRENEKDVDEAENQYPVNPNLGSTAMEYCGSDFWLTRNRHGAGFWDGDLEEALGKRLTDSAHRFAECGTYVGNDGKVYVS